MAYEKENIRIKKNVEVKKELFIVPKYLLYHKQIEMII